MKSLSVSKNVHIYTFPKAETCLNVLKVNNIFVCHIMHVQCACFRHNIKKIPKLFISLLTCFNVFLRISQANLLYDFIFHLTLSLLQFELRHLCPSVLSFLELKDSCETTHWLNLLINIRRLEDIYKKDICKMRNDIVVCVQ